MNKKYKYIFGIGLFLVLVGVVYAITFYENVDIYGNFNVYQPNQWGTANYSVLGVNSTHVTLGNWNLVGQGYEVVAANNLRISEGRNLILGNYNGNIIANANLRESCAWSIVYNLDEQAICSSEKFQAGMQLLRNNATIQYKIYCCEL